MKFLEKLGNCSEMIIPLKDTGTLLKIHMRIPSFKSFLNRNNRGTRNCNFLQHTQRIFRGWLWKCSKCDGGMFFKGMTDFVSEKKLN